MEDILKILSFLKTNYGILGILIFVLSSLIALDYQYNDKRVLHYLGKRLLKKFSFQKKRKIEDHIVFQRIENILIKLQLVDTVKDPERNKAKTIILTIKWKIFKEELLKLSEIQEINKLKTLELKNEILRRFEKINSRYEKSLSLNLPPELIERFLQKYEDRHFEFLVIVESFLGDGEMSNADNLYAVLNYVSAHVMLCTLDAEEIFEEMNGTFDIHRDKIRSIDLLNISIVTN